MTSRLAIYNQALTEFIGESRLASLGEEREARRLLDEAWESSLRKCLEAGFWKFATRSALLDADTTIVPEFGYQYAFLVPQDHIRTIGVWSDAMMSNPHREYREESGPLGRAWVADIDTLYVSYVSDDDSYGRDLSKWPETFAGYVAAELASRIALPLTGNRSKYEDVITLRDKRFKPDALSKDAMSEPTRTIPRGSWVSAKLGAYDRER